MWRDLEKKLKSLSSRVKFSENYVSLALGILVVVVIGILLFNFFQGKQISQKQTPQETTASEKPEETVSLPTTYKVAVGDNLWSIAEKFYHSGYNWVDISSENKLPNPDYLEEGQELRIPKVNPMTPTVGTVNSGAQTQTTISGNSYTVLEGDNLWDISIRAYGDGFQWERIAKANNLANPDLIYAGNVLTLPR